MNFLGQLAAVQWPNKIFKVKRRSFLARSKNFNIAGKRTINDLYNTVKTLSKSVWRLFGNFEEKKKKKKKKTWAKKEVFLQKP